MLKFILGVVTTLIVLLLLLTWAMPALVMYIFIVVFLGGTVA